MSRIRVGHNSQPWLQLLPVEGALWRIRHSGRVSQLESFPQAEPEWLGFLRRLHELGEVSPFAPPTEWVEAEWSFRTRLRGGFGVAFPEDTLVGFGSRDSRARITVSTSCSRSRVLVGDFFGGTKKNLLFVACWPPKLRRLDEYCSHCAGR